MTKQLAISLIAIAGFGLTVTAQAHDPKEHMKDAEKPDCAAMQNMDHSKMDMKDPVMQAMMKQCMQDMHKNDNPHKSLDGNTGDASDSQPKTDEHSGHQH